MNSRTLFAFVAVAAIAFNSCTNKTNNSSAQSANAMPVPQSPVAQYWDKYSFESPTWTSNNDSVEQAFVDYINLFPQASSETIGQSISALLHNALKQDAKLYQTFSDLFNKYLYDPNSPFRHEEYYILTLQAIINSPVIEEAHKIGPRARLQLALKNRVGENAADFAFTQHSGSVTRLTDIYAEFILIFFNNPDCHDCARVKNHILNSTIFNELTKFDGKTTLKIVAIYPDEDIKAWRNTTYPANWINGRSTEVQTQQLYDLKAIPTLYLLDKDKRVILKDATIEQIEARLSNVR